MAKLSRRFQRNPWLQIFSFVQTKKGDEGFILIQSNITAAIIPHLTAVNEVFESLAVELVINNNKFKIVGLYRPPSTSLVDFNALFFNMFRENDRNKFIAIMGDFNIDTLAPAFSNQVNQFLDEIKSLHLMPLINIPTRITESSATCIDHVYINQLTPCKYGVLNVPIADHLQIFCSIPCQSSLNGKKIHIKFSNTSDDCLSKFKSDVEKGLRHFHVYDNLPIDDKFQILNNILENSFNKHCPIKSKCIALKSYCSPWINNTLRDSIKEKHRLYNLCQEDPDFVPLYKQQRKLRNLVSNKIKQAKMQYYNDKFNNNLHDAKSTWKVINKILKPNSKRQNDFQIEENGTTLSDSTEIANAFNDYFSFVAPNLAAEIPDVGIDPLSYLSRNPHSFVYFEVDYTEVKKQILSFKSKPSNIKSIPSFAYKFIVDVLFICNRCSFYLFSLFVLFFVFFCNLFEKSFYL